MKSTLEKRRALRRSQTDAEAELWTALRNKRLGGLKFYRQYGISQYIVDFYCPGLKLVVEVDGGGHFTDDGRAYDGAREEHMKSLGIKTLRFTNRESNEQHRGSFAEYCWPHGSPPHPLFHEEGEGGSPVMQLAAAGGETDLLEPCRAGGLKLWKLKVAPSNEVNNLFSK